MVRMHHIVVAAVAAIGIGPTDIAFGQPADAPAAVIASEQPMTPTQTAAAPSVDDGFVRMDASAASVDQLAAADLDWSTIRNLRHKGRVHHKFA